MSFHNQQLPRTREENQIENKTDGALSGEEQTGNRMTGDVQQRANEEKKGLHVKPSRINEENKGEVNRSDDSDETDTELEDEEENVNSKTGDVDKPPKEHEKALHVKNLHNRACDLIRKNTDCTTEDMTAAVDAFCAGVEQNGGRIDLDSIQNDSHEDGNGGKRSLLGYAVSYLCGARRLSMIQYLVEKGASVDRNAYFLAHGGVQIPLKMLIMKHYKDQDEFWYRWTRVVSTGDDTPAMSPAELVCSGELLKMLKETTCDDQGIYDIAQQLSLETNAKRRHTPASRFVGILAVHDTESRYIYKPANSIDADELTLLIPRRYRGVKELEKEEKNNGIPRWSRMHASSFGETLLHLAVEKRLPAPLVQILVNEWPAALSETSVLGMTPLQVATAFEVVDMCVVNVLGSKHAEIALLGETSMTPLHDVASKSNKATILAVININHHMRYGWDERDACENLDDTDIAKSAAQFLTENKTLTHSEVTELTNLLRTPSRTVSGHATHMTPENNKGHVEDSETFRADVLWLRSVRGSIGTECHQFVTFLNQVPDLGNIDAVSTLIMMYIRFTDHGDQSDLNFLEIVRRYNQTTTDRQTQRSDDDDTVCTSLIAVYNTEQPKETKLRNMFRIITQSQVFYVHDMMSLCACHCAGLLHTCLDDVSPMYKFNATSEEKTRISPLMYMCSVPAHCSGSKWIQVAPDFWKDSRRHVHEITMDIWRRARIEFTTSVLGIASTLFGKWTPKTFTIVDTGIERFMESVVGHTRCHYGIYIQCPDGDIYRPLREFQMTPQQIAHRHSAYDYILSKHDDTCNDIHYLYQYNVLTGSSSYEIEAECVSVGRYPICGNLKSESWCNESVKNTEPSSVLPDNDDHTQTDLEDSTHTTHRTDDHSAIDAADDTSSAREAESDDESNAELTSVF